LRRFKRKFALPENIIEDRLECKLSSNGKTLEVTAPLKCIEPASAPAVRTIPINVEKSGTPSGKESKTPPAVTEGNNGEKPQDQNVQNEQIGKESVDSTS
jgi:hypothetical protein